MKFDVISIIFLVIILLYGFIGYKRGLFKTLTSAFKNIIAFIVALLLCIPLGKLLANTGMGTNLSNWLNDFLISKNEALFNVALTEANKEELALQALNALNLPTLLSGLLVKSLTSIIASIGTIGITLGEALATSLTSYIFMGICFVILFIIVRLLVILLNKLFGALEKIPLIKAVDKTLGVVLSVLKGALLILVITYVFTFIVPLDNCFSNFLVNQMALGDDHVFTISKFLYEKNFLLSLIALIQKLFV